jgi:hypothetical protein
MHTKNAERFRKKLIEQVKSGCVRSSFYLKHFTYVAEVFQKRTSAFTELIIKYTFHVIYEGNYYVHYLSSTVCNCLNGGEAH